MAASVPKKIGKYDVLDVIGKGGMGIVYRAKDPFLDRLVAIKIMTISYTDYPDLLQRFYREAKATAFLQHPNIVTVYELGEHEGNPYFVMEYLEGASLETLVRSGNQLNILQKIDIIVEACHGLSYAHQRGIVHRDIKPGNIMVLKEGTVKIVDFGIARVGDTNFTRTGQFMGSLNYMSPEQLNEGLQIDQRTDVYSTGVVLYQMFTGALPFECESTPATLMKILTEPPPPFSKRLSEYPPEIEAITMKALAKDRDQRYSSADELAFELAQVRDRFKSEMVSSHMHRAELLLQRNSLTEANDELLKVLRLDKQNTKAATLLRTLRKQIEKEQSAERVRQLRDKAEAALHRKEFDPALAYVEQAISLDTTNVDLKQLRDRVLATKSEIEHLWQLRKQADEALLLRKWDEALSLLDQAAAIDGANPELMDLRSSVRRSRTIRADALRRAEQARRAGNLNEAKSAVEEALAIDPADTTAKALNAIISMEIAERSRRKKLDELCLAARREISLGQFGAAHDLLSQAKEIDASAPEIQQLNDSLASARQLEKKRRELEQACNEIEEMLNRDQYREACARADEALRSFPQDQGLLALKSFAERQYEVVSRRLYIESELTSALQLFDGGQLAQAQTALNTALQRFPDDIRLRSFLTTVTDAISKQEARRIDEERRANEQRRFVNLQLSAASELQRGGRTAEALAKLKDALLAYPDSSELVKQCAVLESILAREETLKSQAQQEERRKREEIEKTITLAGQMLDSRLSGQAVSVLEQALRRYPESNVLQAQLEIARSRSAADMAEQERARSETQRQQAEIDKEVLSVRKIIETNNLAQAIAVLESAAHRFPDSADIRSLLESTRQQVEREREEKLRAEERLQRRRQEIDAQIKAARGRLAANQTAAAVAALEQATLDYPENEELAVLLNSARETLRQEEVRQEEATRELRRRQAAIAAEVENARALLKANDSSKALSRLEEALRRYPESAELRSLLSVVKDQVARELAEREREAKRHAELLEETAKVQALLENGEPELAVQACETALRRLGKDQELEALRTRAKDAAKLKKAEDKKRAEDRRRAEEVTRRRESDLATLRQMAGTVPADKRTSVDKLLQKARRIAAQYPGDADIQAAIEELQNALASPAKNVVPDDSLAATRLLTPPAPPKPVATQSGPAPTLPVPVEERTADGAKIDLAALQSKFLTKWTALAVLGLLIVGLSVKYLLSHKKTATSRNLIVTIESHPSGAEIQVGDHNCVTPSCRLTLAPGDYEIHAQLDGYVPWSQSLTIDPQKPVPTVTVELIRKPAPETAGILLVRAGIAGAEVKINGRRYSQTDSSGMLRVELESGSYRVEIQKKLYELPTPQSIQITKGKETTATFMLTPLPMQAELVITGAPANVQVRDNGHELGVTDASGLFSQTVEPGKHEIVLAEGDRASDPIHKSLAAGKRLSLDWKVFSLKSVPSLKAMVIVKSLPAGATVATEGSTYRADQSGTAHFEIPPGEYKLDISAEGYAPRQISRRINSGENVIDVPLDRVDLEKQDWERLTAGGSVSDLNRLQEFLTKYPRGTYTQQAQSTLDKLIASNDSEQELAAFYKSFPNTAAGEAARKRAERLRDTKESLTNRDRIVALLGTLEKAYAKRDVVEVCSIWTNCPRKALEDEFKNFTSVDVKFQLSPDAVQLQGDGVASTECRRVSTTTTRDSKARSTHANDVRIDFRKQGKDWRIGSLEEIRPK